MVVNPHTQHDCHPDRHGDQEHPGPEPAGNDPGQVRVPGVHPNVDVVPLERPAAFGADRVEYTVPEPAMRTGETGIGLCSDHRPVHLGLRNETMTPGSIGTGIFEVKPESGPSRHGKMYDGRDKAPIGNRHSIFFRIVLWLEHLFCCYTNTPRSSGRVPGCIEKNTSMNMSKERRSRTKTGRTCNHNRTAGRHRTTARVPRVSSIGFSVTGIIRATHSCRIQAFRTMPREGVYV
jgi:hypothetical protein